ncbi:sporulation integral membrane protein YlbJ [Effusibacillus lacus]|uniref:Sporulation integral membrane protein YlbJ n=1 Tax=Effusibacillus lacus TaxID=1348429 RepID=A0A292YIL4_9BACL|nr:sporulation integral membrane protein YlbJ [Effusibacillus lacus]TCS75324.1 sporulation integral membrane protein YlbJ [Effusibacillus lacus]GAX89758.1 sporulation integral membrane protein YlbJ [Effusibacillus lacus]
MPGSPQRTTTVLFAIIVVFLTLSLVLYPKEGFEAGIAGLKLFWDVVFPSLLPFFILSEIMLGVGVVHALGILLEPLMRPLFSVPGVGAFALSMGLAAGYPMDAVITAKFRKSKMCSRVEGERLLAFTNTADPYFLLGAVAVGMFRNAGIGMLLLIAHYIGAFLVGILFKLYGRGTQEKAEAAPPVIRGNLFTRAYQELLRARQEDGRPISQLLGDAVNDSIKTLLMICGFIIFFAVIIKVLTLSGIIPLLALPVMALFKLIGIDVSLVQPFLAGIFEIDIGAAQAAATDAVLIQQLIVVSFIVAWSGLSVHAQIASVLTGTDIRFSPYLVARVLHGIFAAIATVVLYNWGVGQTIATVSAPVAPSTLAVAAAEPTTAARWLASLYALKNWFLLIGGITLFSVALYLSRRMKIVVFKTRMNNK